MFVESIVFKRKEDSKWEKGFYVGETENSENCVILDAKYQPVEKLEDGSWIWDYKTDVTNWIQIRC